MEQILIEYRPHLVPILVALIGILGAYALYRRKRFHSAADKFRSSFLAEIGGVANNNWDLDSVSAIKNAIPSQALVVSEFCGFLLLKRASFVNAWEQYKAYCNGIDYEQYRLSHFYPTMGEGPLPHPKEEFMVHLNRVLSYAKQT